MFSALLLGVLGASDCPPIQSGATLPDGGDMFGVTMATVGDIDGDSVEDVAIGCPLFGTDRDVPGRVWIVSARTGKPLLELQAGERADRFGDQIIAPGDLDGDGVPDIVASCGGSFVSNRVIAFSGKRGWRIPGAVEQPRDRVLLCAVGDVNRDGRADYAVAGTNPSPPPSRPDPSRRDRFAVVIVDGATGNTLERLEPEDGQCWASAMATAGDLDGDGVQDLVLAHRRSARPIEIWSLGTGTQLHAISALDTSEAYDVTLAAPGDVDSDGVPDLLVGLVSGYPGRSRVALIDGYTMKELATFVHPDLHAFDARSRIWSFGEMLLPLPPVSRAVGPRLLIGVPKSSMEISRVLLLSLPDGSVVRSHEGGDTWQGMFGVAACLAGDADGDGVRDYVVGEANWRSAGMDSGHAYLYSGRTGRQLDHWSRAAMTKRARSGPAAR